MIEALLAEIEPYATAYGQTRTLERSQAPCLARCPPIDLDYPRTERRLGAECSLNNNITLDT